MKLCLRAVTLQLSGQEILAPINLEITQPGLIALMGPSGIGKSLLLRIIAGLLLPTSGRRECDGNISIVFQDSRLLPWQNALSNVAFGLRAQGIDLEEVLQRARTYLAQLGFTNEDMQKHPRALSGGMRRRVAIARALATEPSLLLLDEPFTALDAARRAELYQTLKDITDKKRLVSILITHDPAEAVTLAARILVLGDRPARIVADIPCPTRPNDAAEAYRAAAALMQRPELAAFSLPASEYRLNCIKSDDHTQI
jgi:NitT/TauT family transport system ATP-binding protein